MNQNVKWILENIEKFPSIQKHQARKIREAETISGDMMRDD